MAAFCDTPARSSSRRASAPATRAAAQSSAGGSAPTSVTEYDTDICYYCHGKHPKSGCPIKAKPAEQRTANEKAKLAAAKRKQNQLRRARTEYFRNK